MQAGRPTEEVIAQLPWWLGFNAQNNSGRTALHIASEYGRDKIARALIKHGADVNAESPGRTALHIVVEYGRDKVARVLLEHGANVNAKDKGSTPLDKAYAVEKDDLFPVPQKEIQAVITLLRKHGAKTAHELSAEAKEKAKK